MLLSAYLFVRPAHCCHPSRSSIIILPIHFIAVSLDLSSLPSILARYRRVLQTLLPAHLFIRLLVQIPQLFLCHFWYPTLVTNYPHRPSSSLPTFIRLPFNHLFLLVVIIWSTYPLQSHLTFKYHFIIFCLRLRLCFIIHLYDLGLVPRIRFNRQHFELLHELGLNQFQHHHLLLKCHFAHLIIGSPWHINHFSINSKLSMT